MVFNFYINSQPDDNNKEDLEDIMKSIENHFADWNDFFTYFGRTCGIPEKNAKRIQQYFNDLREDFVEIIKTYNSKIRKFADIQEQDTPDEFEKEVINQMKSMMNFNKKEMKDDFNMYN